MADKPLFKDVKAAPVKVGENFQLDTQQADMDDQLAETIRFAAQQGLRQIEIKLSPENLGSLTVKLTQAADGTLQIVLHTANSKAASLLTQHLDGLNTALQGYGQTQVQVEVQRNENSQQAEQQFQLENLADPENTTLSHHINQAIKARGVMKRDIDYVVKDGQVIIVDEFTGRLMFGRRYNEGLHQAIEAKEGVEVANESKTLATITFQNYFRLYDKLSGMTGTALTEEEEFGTIYELDIVENSPPTSPWPVLTSPMWCIRMSPASCGPLWSRSRPATPRASPCWWAPCPSRSPSW